MFFGAQLSGAFALGDKEIAVRIRSNSHYRITFKSSRNAYRFAHVKVSWAKGEAVERLWAG